MKTFLLIITIILGVALMVMGFLLEESIDNNRWQKAENWDKEQATADLRTIIKAQTTEIRGLKQSNQNCDTLIENSCGSELGEIRRLKELNSKCIKGLNQCIIELTKQL